MGTQRRTELSPGRRTVGWRPGVLGDRYDVVVLGDGVVALAVAWRLASLRARSRVAVLAPTMVGASCDPTAAARLHALRPERFVAPLLPEATTALRRCLADLGLERSRVISGHLTIATTVDEWARAGEVAARLPSCRPVDDPTLLDLVPVLEAGAALGAWYEPEATTVELPEILFTLARAAVEAGVDLVDGAAVEHLGGHSGRFELVTSAGTTCAGAVVDADPSLALSAAAGAVGLTTRTSSRVVRTAPISPLFGAMQIDGIFLRQRADGTVELELPDRAGRDRRGLAAAAGEVRAVVDAIPALAGASIVDYRERWESAPADGLPLCGPVVEGLWATGGWGRCELDVVALVAESLAAAVLGGPLAPWSVPFAPGRLTGRAVEADGSAHPRACPVCGVRPSDEYRFVDGRRWHVAGCGTLIGADVEVIDLRDRGDADPGDGAVLSDPAGSEAPEHDRSDRPLTPVSGGGTAT